MASLPIKKSAPGPPHAGEAWHFSPAPSPKVRACRHLQPKQPALPLRQSSDNLPGSNYPGPQGALSQRGFESPFANPQSDMLRPPAEAGDSDSCSPKSPSPLGRKASQTQSVTWPSCDAPSSDTEAFQPAPCGDTAAAVPDPKQHALPATESCDLNLIMLMNQLMKAKGGSSGRGKGHAPLPPLNLRRGRQGSFVADHQAGTPGRGQKLLVARSDGGAVLGLEDPILPR